VIEWKAVCAVAIGAAIGGVARYVVGQVFAQRFGPGFPYGTLFINVSGSFLIGVLAELATSRAFGVTPLVRVFAATGILGGYTTFSAFSLDALVLVSDGAALLAALYAAGSVALGVIAAYAGLVLARVTIR
jgi:fluoride exporter